MYFTFLFLVVFLTGD